MSVEPHKLLELAEPFAADDIEWRVSRSWPKGDKVICTVLAYITARAIMARLDAVCGPENWKNTPQEIRELRPGTFSVQVGISIRIGDEWITKYDVSEPTNIEPAKGGFSGAMKRAGAAWSIGRYLYSLDEEYAETSETPHKGWNWAKLADKQGGGSFYWKPPKLPSWAMPADKDSADDKKVGMDEVDSLKAKWRKKFAPKERDRQKLWDGWKTFVFQLTGEFPLQDADCWTQNMLKVVHGLIDQTSNNTSGPSADVPFGK